MQHRHTLETVATRRAFNQAGVGQAMGFIVALVFGLISWNLVKSGYEVGGTIIGTVDIVSLVAVFVTGRKK